MTSNPTSSLNGKDSTSRSCSPHGSSSPKSSVEKPSRMLWSFSTITSTPLSSTSGCSSGTQLSSPSMPSSSPSSPSSMVSSGSLRFTPETTTSDEQNES